jgi:photosystem II stability/assembly factor-like uncharacterized protein
MLSATIMPLGGWEVLSKSFSAASIGIAFKDQTTGWTTFTDGASAPSIVQTTNSGANWSKVNSTGGSLAMPTAFAANHKDGVVASTGLLSNRHSKDGQNFEKLVGAPAISQSLKFEAGRFVAAGPKGVCFSAGESKVFTCKNNVPLKRPARVELATFLLPRVPC